jgi:PAS domain-containing protein
VALVFDGSESTPAGVVKCARSASDEEGLRREAATLQLIERTRPELGGVPQFSSFGRRCGRLTLTESAVAGTPMLSTLDAVSFAPYAVRVTDRLAELAGTAMPTPRDAWWSRLVEEPLLALERTFEAVLYQEELKRARAVLSSLGDMPLVVEHRDCAPWNILVADRGALAFIDWESSEPSGLPGLDLVYFLAQAALLVEGHFELDVQASYARSLDPATPTGAVARRCEAAYAKRVGFDDELWPALRLLCWTVHAQSDWRHLSLEAAGEPDRAALHSSGFLMLWRTVMDQTPAVLGQMS